MGYKHDSIQEDEDDVEALTIPSYSVASAVPADVLKTAGDLVQWFHIKESDAAKRSGLPGFVVYFTEPV